MNGINLQKLKIQKIIDTQKTKNHLAVGNE